ncbi:ribosomal L23P [Tubulinosema ratisbonensis]|uniref:Ribosomal L23P n=1 Tax=Tubulinosema ratisbonensis TaxID=291195 RepID=A0A437AJ86_9MICR|nr:ribosomal L23P [Tubulinosema ratisbonensis]
MKIERKQKKITKKTLINKLPTNPADIIKYGINNENTARMIERDNTLVFACEIKATKPEIKVAVQQLYNTEVKKVRTLISMKGYKKAFVVLKNDGDAIKIANEAGII